MKKIYILILSVFLMTSCSLKEDDSFNFHYETLPIKTIDLPSSFELNKTYDIKVTYEIPNGCYSFHSVHYASKDAERTIAINTIVNNEGECTDALETLETKEHTLRLIAKQKEDYVFKIWKGKNDSSSEDIFEEITVPVIEP